jgi:4-hydroxybutyrate CoA-transferase
MSSSQLRGYNWREDYRKKLTTAQDAIRAVKSGDSVYIQSNAAASLPLIDAMVASAERLQNVSIIHLLTFGEAPYAGPEYSKSFRVHALFIGANVRDAVNEGRAHYTPVFLSEVPHLFTSRAVPVDVCLVQVSPPDAHGYCSYGVSVDCTLAARKQARVVIAEVNRQMPRTLGRSFVHVSRLTHIVETDRSLPEHVSPAPSSVERSIGEHVESLVEDGATLQVGIGGIPDATLAFLNEKKDLGVHSEMFSDGVVDLVEAGVVTNDMKTVLPGKMAVSFVFGTKRLYDFVDDNPSVEFQTSDFINNPNIIAQNHKMTSINSALQVDITGQVSADSIGHTLYSGVGGQVDFVRGASRSKEGKAIIALPSTATADAVSRIVPVLEPGAGVVTSRADVHYVVTEYGVANLFGKSVRERARELISIAHPKFRASLERECARIKWLRS